MSFQQSSFPLLHFLNQSSHHVAVWTNEKTGLGRLGCWTLIASFERIFLVAFRTKKLRQLHEILFSW